ncbi:MAG TPA: hypothetical protein VER03_01850 [Bryobacteraceae bacterium]|nr:hypothetical protein [Bryobacteraceae bacterium]
MDTVDLSSYFATVFGSGYVTDTFSPVDPRNVAPGANTATVTANLSAWDKAQDFMRQNKTGIYWAAAGLVALAVLKGRR